MASDNKYEYIPIISTWNLFGIAYVLRMPQWYLLKELDRILWGRPATAGYKNQSHWGDCFIQCVRTHVSLLTADDTHTTFFLLY